MDPNRTDPHEKERFLSGVKTAAFVVILGAVALMADHTFFVAPQKAPAALGLNMRRRNQRALPASSSDSVNGVPGAPTDRSTRHWMGLISAMRQKGTPTSGRP